VSELVSALELELVLVSALVSVSVLAWVSEPVLELVSV
jgi:hypothetical protein